METEATGAMEAFTGTGVLDTRGARASNAAGRREIILKTSKGGRTAITEASYSLQYLHGQYFGDATRAKIIHFSEKKGLTS